MLTGKYRETPQTVTQSSAVGVDGERVSQTIGGTPQLGFIFLNKS